MKTPVTAAAISVVVAALTLSACGQSGASDPNTTTTSDTVSVSQSSTSKSTAVTSSNGMMTILPAGNLMIQVPEDAITEATTTYDDGMQQTYYDSRSGIPLTVAVEYYAAGRPVHSAKGHSYRGSWRNRRKPHGLAGQGDPTLAAGP